MADAAKRARLNDLTAAVQAEVDDIVATELPDIGAQIDALAAVANRTAAQNVDLRSLRRDRRQFRLLVKLARLVLLVAGRARPSDVNGSDG